MTPGLSYAWPPKWSLCPSSLGVALVPWVAPLQTPRPRTRSLLPRTSALSQAQAGHCPSVQETGPSLPRLLKREGPPPWGEVGASGERCMAEMAVGRGCDCPQSGGRPASSHGRLKTATLERITVTVWDLRLGAVSPALSPGFQRGGWGQLAGPGWFLTGESGTAHPQDAPLMCRAGAVHTAFHLTLTFPLRDGPRCLHFTDGETEAQRHRVTCRVGHGAGNSTPKGGLAPTAQSL